MKKVNAYDGNIIYRKSIYNQVLQRKVRLHDSIKKRRKTKGNICNHKMEAV